jgi:hypothetical protein
MKIMIVGDWEWPQYEMAFESALSNLGHQVFRVKVNNKLKNKFLVLLSQLPFFYFLNYSINNEIILNAKKYSPEKILFWKPTKIYVSTLKLLKNLGFSIMSYNNDCAFPDYRYHKSKFLFYLKWYQYKKCVKYFDINFVYRISDIEKLDAIGSPNTKIIMPYFIPSIDKRFECLESEKLRFKADVIFIGHYENDGRDAILRALHDNQVDVAVWGSESWKNSKYLVGTGIYRGLSLLGSDYRKAISSAKMALCFLSKLNRDEYTRRNFEIPATGTVLVSECTDALLTLFKENEEAIFFKDVHDLIRKVRMLLDDECMRTTIAKAGYERIWASGYDVDATAVRFLESLNAK